MKVFAYGAYDRAGLLVEGEIHASSATAASSVLWQKGLTTFEVREGGSGRGSRVVKSLSAPSGRHVAAFTREFASLIGSGVPLDDALRVIADQPGLGRMRPIVDRLLDSILGGLSLSEAFAMQNSVFPSDFISMARAAEIGSEKHRVFSDLADLLERRQELAGKTTSALIYPVTLLLMAVGSVAVVIGILVPSLAPIFAESGRPAPMMISFVLSVQRSGGLLALGVGLAGAVFMFGALAATRSESARIAVDRMILRLPFIGSLSKEHNFSRFARTLGSLLGAGVPMISSFASASDVVRNRAMLAGLTDANARLCNGESLSRTLSGVDGIPPLGLRMITIGEETAQLNTMLVRAAAVLEQHGQRRVERLMTLLTPTLTVIVACVVGALIMTVMTTILSVNELAVH